MNWIGESLESVEAGDGENVEGFAVVGLILFHLATTNFPSNRACFFPVSAPESCRQMKKPHALNFLVIMNYT
jgi:hypothetical protein